MVGRKCLAGGPNCRRTYPYAAVMRGADSSSPGRNLQHKDGARETRSRKSAPLSSRLFLETRRGDWAEIARGVQHGRGLD